MARGIGQAGDGAKPSRVTSEMIQAGVTAYLSAASHDEMSFSTPEEVVERVLAVALGQGDTASGEAESSRQELIRRVAGMLADWEESGELYREFAERLIEVIVAADSQDKQPGCKAEPVSGASSGDSS